MRWVRLSEEDSWALIVATIILSISVLVGWAVGLIVAPLVTFTMRVLVSMLVTLVVQRFFLLRFGKTP